MSHNMLRIFKMYKKNYTNVEDHIITLMLMDLARKNKLIVIN